MATELVRLSVVRVVPHQNRAVAHVGVGGDAQELWGVEVHYRVELSDPLRGDEAARFATGTFMLDGDAKPLRPAIWNADSARGGVMILTEGRYHQIRRMFAALGNRVTALHRFQTGDLPLGDLEAGQYRILGPEELASIFGPPC